MKNFPGLDPEDEETQALTTIVEEFRIETLSVAVGNALARFFRP